MELTATIAEVLPMISGTSARGEWSKATVVVKWMDGQYEQMLALENMKNAEEFSQLPVGSTYVFNINVTSRNVNGRYFTTAMCWRWTPVGGVQQPMQQQYAAPQQQYAAPQQPQYAMPSNSPFAVPNIP